MAKLLGLGNGGKSVVGLKGGNAHNRNRCDEKQNEKQAQVKGYSMISLSHLPI